jgi:hypothetical protein
MSTHPYDDTSNVPSTVAVVQGVEFANPRLQPLVSSARVNSTRRWVKGVALAAAAWLAIPLVPLFVYAFMPDIIKVFLPGPLVVILWACISFPATASVFYRLRRRARRHRINALTDLRKDHRDPVFYLRSFYTDDVQSNDRLTMQTDEEVLTLALREVGPVLAVGRPARYGEPREGEGYGGDLPLLGATRIYFGDADWQKAVGALMRLSQVVVINAGNSEGLLWEIEAAVRNVEPTKLLMSFLPWHPLDKRSREIRYQSFKARAEQIFKKSEPKNDAGEMPLGKDFELPEKLGDAVFFVFGLGWEVKPIKIRKLKRLFYGLSSPTMIREVLRPALMDRGITLGRLRTAGYYTLVLSPLWTHLMLVTLVYLFRNPPPILYVLVSIITVLSYVSLVFALFLFGYAIWRLLISMIQRKASYVELDIKRG